MRVVNPSVKLRIALVALGTSTLASASAAAYPPASALAPAPASQAAAASSAPVIAPAPAPAASPGRYGAAPSAAAVVAPAVSVGAKAAPAIRLGAKAAPAAPAPAIGVAAKAAPAAPEAPAPAAPLASAEDPSAAPDGASAVTEAAPAAPQAAPVASATKAPDPTVAVAAEPPADADKPWYTRIDVGAFVDAYYSQNWRGARPDAGANLYQPYTANSGFGLAWIGLDASVEPDPVGATLQLRFGPAVPNLALGDAAIPGGIGQVQNGFVSWKPSGKAGRLTLIVGKFDTVYGAEVAQSHLNMNYTRGYLYNLAQPFFHTGARADFQVNDAIALKVLAVNGWNNTIDNNRGKSVGAQAAVTPKDGLTLSFGYMVGPEEPDTIAAPASASGGPGAGTVVNLGANSRLRHLFDIVGDMKVTSRLRLVANADYVTQTVADSGTQAYRQVSWSGAALLARYAFTDIWAAAVRGEVVFDRDGQISAPNVAPLSLYTGTFTVEAAPHKMLLIRLDNRVDAGDRDVFKQGASGTASAQFTTTLGIVAKTN